MVEIGFVGTGVIAWAHAIGIQAMKQAGMVDVSLVAVHDLDGERAAGFALANGAVAVPDASEVLDRCEAVWVCTPTAFHREVVEEALTRGRAVFCEKPLALSLEEAQAMATAVSEAKAVAQVGLVLRRAPVFRALRELLASGVLGSPMTALLHDDQYFPVQGVYNSTWRADVRIAGGGCLIEHSIHDLDILRFCLGEVREVAARTANFAGHPGVEDLAIVSMQLTSGAVAEVASVWHSIMSRGSTRRLEVFCENGLIWLENDFLGPLHVETSDAKEIRACPAPEWLWDLPLSDDEVGLAIRSYVEADRAFLDALSAGRTAEPSFDEAVVAHRMVEAAYASAASGGSPRSIEA